MTAAHAHALLDRQEDADTIGDPKCRICHGDGSREVRDGSPGPRVFARCACRYRIDEALDLVGAARR